MTSNEPLILDPAKECTIVNEPSTVQVADPEELVSMVCPLDFIEVEAGFASAHSFVFHWPLFEQDDFKVGASEGAMQGFFLQFPFLPVKSYYAATLPIGTNVAVHDDRQHKALVAHAASTEFGRAFEWLDDSVTPPQRVKV